MLNDYTKVTNDVNQGDLWRVVVSDREGLRRCHFCRVPCMDAQRMKSLKTRVRTEAKVMILFTPCCEQSSWFGARCVGVVPVVLTCDVTSSATKKIVREVL